MVSRALKVTTQNQLNSAKSYLIGVLIAVFLLLILGFEYQFVLVFSFMLLVDGLLVLITHYKYLMLNKKLQVNVRYGFLDLSYKTDHFCIRPEEVKQIDLYLTPSRIGGNKMELLGVESYYYAVISTLNGEKFVLTSLLSLKLESMLCSTSFKSKIVRHKVFIAYKKKHFDLDYFQA